MKLSKIGKIIGYVFFGIFIFILFTYLNFPYHKLQDKLFLQIEQQTGLLIDVDVFKTTLLLGVKLSGVTLSHKRLDLPPMRIPELSVSPSLMSLITFQPKIKFKIDFLEGSARGKIGINGNSQSFDLTIQDLNIKNQFKDYLPMGLAGMLDGSFNLSGDFQKFQNLEGKIDMMVQKFILDKTTVMNMDIPQISLSRIVFAGTLKKDHFVLDKVEMGSDKEDIKAQVTGDILLNARRFVDSRLNLKLKFKLSEKFKQEFKLFLPFIANALGPDGSYSLNITGTFTAPLALPQKM